jgi:hypothetical protein
MFTKVLIANRGDQPAKAGAAAKPNCVFVEDKAGDFAAEVKNVY